MEGGRRGRRVFLKDLEFFKYLKYISGAAGALTPPGTGSESSARAKAPPGAGSESLAGAFAPPARVFRRDEGPAGGGAAKI